MDALSRTTPSRRLARLLALACTAACAAPGDGAASVEPGPAASPSVWPDTFTEPAVLIADDVRIEGPRGLLDHFAVRVEERFHVRTEKTTPDGYLQRVTVRSDGVQAEIRAWLDELEIVALRSLTALERPGEADLFVGAGGDAYWRSAADGRERRGELLHLAGGSER
ncbi:MAG: hypothetical protein QF903_11415 [Planctomycetota bacterium]|nr:hypothetical protein [Planctomycetota bacterium]MDP6762184.1 hypothetical protein [Planctomycetota bacterium]MDP6990072.1 hypothetical protein [Planctomycetota bacterium]